MLEEAYINILSGQGDGTEDRAAPTQVSSEDRAASAASAGRSEQRTSKIKTRRSARKYKKKLSIRVL